MNDESRGAVLIVRDITERKRAEERRQLLINELNHRVKNTLAVVQAIAQQSFRGEAIPLEHRRAFEARLHALATAHNTLTREDWKHANLTEIVIGALAPFSKVEDGRLIVAGPDISLEPKTAVTLAMALHELATNAVKYGSLSNETGRVVIAWSVADCRLKLTWREEGGPPVTEPKRRGFGSRMVERGLASELRGHVKLGFEASGLTCTVDASLPSSGVPGHGLAAE